jgi:hypothetical protein
VSASRTPERVLESPVTIERMGIADIKSQSATFYDGLENMKEVQMNTSSLSLSLSIPWFCSCKYAFHAVGWWNGITLLY